MYPPTDVGNSEKRLGISRVAGRVPYCDKSSRPTREYVIPDWYNDTPGEAKTFIARAPLTQVQGDLIVRDVYATCNNVALSGLDGYGKDLYERYFARPVYAGETVTFDYDGDRLLRWLLRACGDSGLVGVEGSAVICGL